jgi:hypothetical protein
MATFSQLLVLAKWRKRKKMHSLHFLPLSTYLSTTGAQVCVFLFSISVYLSVSIRKKPYRTGKTILYLRFLCVSYNIVRNNWNGGKSCLVFKDIAAYFSITFSLSIFLSIIPPSFFWFIYLQLIEHNPP